MKLANYLKTAVLLGLLTGLMLAVGNLLGGQIGLIIALIFAIILNFVSYWFSDKISLAVYRAKKVSESEQPKLHQMVREVARAAKIPVPGVYIINAPYANAFATGRNPKHAAVAVTKGIMQLLDEDELRGVIAHEIAHIKNRDTLIAAVAATIAGVISFLANMAQFAAIFGGGRDNDNNSGIQLLILAILTPIIAALIQLAISRSREYVADASGASFVKDGKFLASALEKLEKAGDRIALRPTPQTEASAHQFISNPFRGKGMWHLLSTHPSTEERAKRLRALRF